MIWEIVKAAPGWLACAFLVASRFNWRRRDGWR